MPREGGEGVEMWLVWIIIAVILFIGEILIPGFFLLWFGIGALLSLLLSFSGASVFWQLVVWAVSSTVLFLVTKPLTANWTKRGSSYPKFMDTFIGKPALVTKTVDNVSGTGLVKVGSDVWSAKSERDDIVFHEGDKVLIVGHEGNRLVVSAPPDPE